MIRAEIVLKNSWGVMERAKVDGLDIVRVQFLGPKAKARA